MRILHHQPAHTHSTVVAFNLSQFTAAIDEINHVITHGNKCHGSLLFAFISMCYYMVYFIYGCGKLG